jgi:hypothetical protein
MRRPGHYAVTLTLAWGLAAATGARAEDPDPGGPEHNVDPKTGAEHWAIDRDSVTLALTQRTPEQVRAFYLGRGFPPELARRIADHCVLVVSLRNQSQAPIHYDLDGWRYVTSDGTVRSPRPKEDWIREWREYGVIFGFSQLSGAQTFQPGDWNGAMVTFDVLHDGRFDLHYQWTTQGREITGTIKGVHCAPEPS